VPLGDFRQAGGKRVHLFTVEGDFDPKSLRSNLTKVEWPPRSGRSMTVPEIDRVQWFTVAQARTMMLASQIVALDRLADHLR
jgi:predicted NUDIX family NTP pyrophosphohydrolase